MGKANLPPMQDVEYRRFANQFVRSPADPFFTQRAAYFLTRIQGNNNWALGVTLIGGGSPVLIRGRRDIDLIHPIVIQSIEGVPNGTVFEVCGFMMPYGTGGP